jgi:hypothetical protein
MFWSRVRSLVFLNSLACQTGRCASPPPIAASYTSQKNINIPSNSDRLKRPSPCPDLLTRVRICKSFKEPRNRFPACWAGTTTHLSYRAAWLHRLGESIPRNRFLGLLNVSKYGLSVPDLSTKQGTYPYISRCSRFGIEGTASFWASQCRIANYLYGSAL